MEVEIIALGVWQFVKKTNIAAARKNCCAIEGNF
jgi:hypothetical protein